MEQVAEGVGAKPHHIVLDRKEAIKKMASHAVSLDNGQEISHPRNFLNLLKQVNPNDPALKIIERDLQRHLNREDISILSPSCEGYLQDLEGFIRNYADKLKDFTFQAELSDRVEETIYKIAQYIRGTGFKTSSVILNPKEAGEGSYHSRYGVRLEDASLIARSDNWRDKYGDIIGVLQQISGCAGGGSRSIKVLGGSFSAILSSNSSLKSLETDQYGSLEFPCGKCKATNRRPYGQLIPNCQHCGASTSC